MELDLGAAWLRRKVGALEGSAHKMRHMLYELSLAEGGAIARVAADPTADPADAGKLAAAAGQGTDGNERF